MDSYKLQPIRRQAAGLALVTILLTGCVTTRTEYVPVTAVVTEYRDRAVHDTTYIERERVTERRGDTVFVDKV